MDELVKVLVAECDRLRIRAEKAEAEVRAAHVVFGKIAEIVREFKTSTDRWETRARRLLSTLGITAGVRRERTNKEHLFLEYIGLTLGKTDINTLEWTPPVGREEALEILAKRHGLASAEACLKQLRAHTRKMKAITGSTGYDKILPGSDPYK